MPKAFYRRKLPHLQRDGKPHFLTFCTHQRWILPEAARDVALGCCLHDINIKIDISAVVVMPDHVHMIFTPLVNEQAGEVYTLREIMDAIKGASAHKINRQLGRTGKLWQTESYDRVLRSSENSMRRLSTSLTIRFEKDSRQHAKSIAGYGQGSRRIPTSPTHPRRDSRPRPSRGAKRQMRSLKANP